METGPLCGQDPTADGSPEGEPWSFVVGIATVDESIFGLEISLFFSLFGWGPKK